MPETRHGRRCQVSGGTLMWDQLWCVNLKLLRAEWWLQAWPPRHNASGKKDKKRLVCKKLRFVKTNKQRQRQGEVSCSCRSDNKHTIWRFIFQFNAHCDNFSPDLLLVTPIHLFYLLTSAPHSHLGFVLSLSLLKYFLNILVFYFTHLIHNLDV